jgi:hypothetical protein
MSKPNDQFAGLGTLVPGFDFLKSLTQGAASGAAKMPSLSSWVAPTINIEDLEKRIAELKAVHFWLDQNGKALSATIQALEVQKMTLVTLKGMNVSMNELASAFKLPEADDAPAKPAAKPAPAPSPAPAPAKKTRAKSDASAEAGGAAAGVVDPMQWWNSLGSQFQAIAANAVKDMPAMPDVLKAAAPAKKAPAKKSKKA